MENLFFNAFAKWEQTQGGVISSSNIPAELMDEYRSIMDEFKRLDNKKVEIFFTASSDFLRSNGSKKGKIIVKDNEVRFYEGRKTSKYYRLDAGIYDGWFATLCPLKINILN